MKIGVSRSFDATPPTIPVFQMFKRALFFLALCVCAAGQAATLSAEQPLSAWRGASLGDKTQLIEAVAGQLSSSAGFQASVAIPVNVIAQCVDRNPTPDRLTIHGHEATVTVGLAVVLCIKVHVPPLRTARYTLSAH
jgi:hypothetical protein